MIEQVSIPYLTVVWRNVFLPVWDFFLPAWDSQVYFIECSPSLDSTREVAAPVAVSPMLSGSSAGSPGPPPVAAPPVGPGPSTGSLGPRLSRFGHVGNASRCNRVPIRLPFGAWHLVGARGDGHRLVAQLAWMRWRWSDKYTPLHCIMTSTYVSFGKWVGTHLLAPICCYWLLARIRGRWRGAHGPDLQKSPRPDVAPALTLQRSSEELGTERKKWSGIKDSNVLP